MMSPEVSAEPALPLGATSHHFLPPFTSAPFIVNNASSNNASHVTDDNVTSSSFRPAEEAANYWALLLLVLPLLTALGNLMVIASVAGEKALQTSTNFLIVSLAVADFLVAILVMPWGIYVLVSGDKVYCSIIYCLLYVSENMA